MTRYVDDGQEKRTHSLFTLFRRPDSIAARHRAAVPLIFGCRLYQSDSGRRPYGVFDDVFYTTLAGSMSTPSTDSLSFVDRLARIPAALWALLGIGTVMLSGCGMNLVDRIQQPQWGICGTLVIVLDIVALVDLIGDRGRSAANKIIWSLVIIFMPIVGVLLYFFIGR
jgi:hypothetical protein